MAAAAGRLSIAYHGGSWRLSGYVLWYHRHYTSTSSVFVRLPTCWPALRRRAASVIIRSEETIVKSLQNKLNKTNEHKQIKTRKQITWKIRLTVHQSLYIYGMTDFRVYSKPIVFSTVKVTVNSNRKVFPYLVISFFVS